MDRTQKKCLIASTGVHLLLAVILVVGPAFLSSKGQSDNLPVLDFIPVKTVDALVSGGGERDAKPPPSAPAPQPPAPQPLPAPAIEKPIVKESPKEEEVKPLKPEPDSLEPAKEHKKLPDVSTALTTRTKDKAEKTREEARDREQAKALADARRRAAQEIDQAVDNIASGISGSTALKLRGPGGGGLPYANFLQAVKSVYDRAWIAPDGAAEGDAVVTASVTIARDGTVISARITNASGNSAVDRSVQAALDRVRKAAPLPDDAKEDQRTVDIRFNAKAKRASA
jgi:colicin import membrane protein